MMKSLLLPIALIAVFSHEARAAARLAILSEPGAQREAALLAVELSRQPVILLERAEIDRILDERRLALAGLADAQLPQVGRLLGADGIVFLTTHPVFAMRIVAVHPGVIVESSRESAPADAAEWSRRAAARIAALLPKFAVGEKAAVPVSVVGVRATRSRPEAAELERETALLLTHRLAHEPAIFVLERERMETVQREKEDGAAEKFWTGRWLIDGTIEQALGEPDALTISVRVEKAGGGPPATIRRSCQRAELAGAVDALAREIARVLQQEPSAIAWDADAEAVRFWREAQWAFQNEVFPRAAVAAESSWVLGRRAAETMTLRVRAELLAARPELVVPYQFPKQYLTDYLSQRNFHWRAQLPFTRGYRTPDVLAKIFQTMPDAERELRLAGTLRALDLYGDHFAELCAKPGQLPLANEALAIGGAMLEWFHHNRSAWDDRMRALAARLREADALATARLREFGARADGKQAAQFWQIKAALTPIWAADAAQTLAAFRAALREPFDAEARAILCVTLVHGRDLFPELTAAGSARDAKLWPAFVDELLASKFPGDRWMGLFFQYDNAAGADRDAIAAKLRDSFWAERARFAKHELPFDYFHLLRLPRPASQHEWPERDFHQRFLLYLLRESTPIDSDSFSGLFDPKTCDAAAASALYDAILAHDGRVRARLGDHWMLSRIRERTEELLLRYPNLRRTESGAGTLTLTRYWHPFGLPQFRDGSLKRGNLGFKEALYADGRLWIFATFDGPERGRDVARPEFIFGIDLKTFATEVIPFEQPPPPATKRTDQWGDADIEVSSEAIFVSKEWQLSRYDRRAKTWRHFPNLPGVWQRPWQIGGRLYVRTNNSAQGIQVQHFGEMVEMDLQTDAVTLLVSDRRSPAESPLDAWPLSWLTARAGPGGRVFFRGIGGDGSAKNRYATYDPAARKWEALDEAAWKTVPGIEAAHMASASEDSEWTVEPRGRGRDVLSLKRGDRLLPFRCELGAEDRAQLARNGGDPSLELIESNLMPGHGVAPLCYETPDGLAISPVFYMPGFWFVPSAKLGKARK